jgi:hypothetical protein
LRGREPDKTTLRAAAIAAALTLLAIVISGCGGSDDDSDLATLAPPDAPLYAEVTLAPDENQTEAIRSLASEAEGVEDPGAALVEELDRELSSGGLELTYAEDIQPWLGTHGAFFVRSFENGNSFGLPDFAALLEIEDANGANAFIEKIAEADPAADEPRSYGGFDYLYGSDEGGYAIGVVDEALVIGTEASFKVAVDASEGESLAESEEYGDRTDALGEDRLATVLLEPTAVVEAALASEDISGANARLVRPLLAGLLAGPISAGIGIGDDSAALELVTSVDDEDAFEADPELLEGLPAAAAFAVGVPDAGAILEKGIDSVRTSGLPGAVELRRVVEGDIGIDLSTDVARWLGDFSGYVAGSSALDAAFGIVAETTDPAGPEALLDALQALIEREEPDVPVGGPPEGAEYGFTIGFPGIGPSAGAGVFGDELVASLGATPGEVLAPSSPLADDDLFGNARDALGDDFAPVFYINLPAMLPILQAGGVDDGRDYAETQPWFEALEYVIAGTRVEDGLATVRLTVAVP